MIYSKEIVRKWLDEVAERAKDHPKWVDVFERYYTDTLDNTVEILEDGSTFVLTGDIPAMWLRDSTAQLRPYLHVAKRLTTRTLMVGSGNASTRWTRFAILCNWLISFGKRLARPVSLMRLLSQRPRKFFIFGQWNKTTTIHLIVLSVIRTAGKTPW